MLTVNALRARMLSVDLWLLMHIKILLPPATPVPSTVLTKEPLPGHVYRKLSGQRRDHSRRSGTQVFRRGAGGTALPGCPNPATTICPAGGLCLGNINFRLCLERMAKKSIQDNVSVLDCYFRFQSRPRICPCEGGVGDIYQVRHLWDRIIQLT